MYTVTRRGVVKTAPPNALRRGLPPSANRLVKMPPATPRKKP